MEKDQIIILEGRGIVSVAGEDAREFLQNIVSNNVDKVSSIRSVFSGIFTPQGKYLFEFFLIKSMNGYFLDCDNEITQDLIDCLLKYKLRSKIEIQNLSSNYVVGIINKEKFNDIQKSISSSNQTLIYRDSPCFMDPRSENMGARILSNLENLYLTIKKLNLEIIKEDVYLKNAHTIGIPVKGVKMLQDKLFGLEANFEEFNAIDFKKGCYVGQENTARMKLKNKLRRKILPLESGIILEIDSEIKYEDKRIGKVLLSKPYPFALIKLFDPDIKEFNKKELTCGNQKIKII